MRRSRCWRAAPDSPCCCRSWCGACRDSKDRRLRFLRLPPSRCSTGKSRSTRRMKDRAMAHYSIPRCVLAAMLVMAPAGAFSAAEADYPAAQRGTQTDDYHGVKVADPYRWMEDIDAPATRAWIEAEAQRTSDYLAAIPGRNKIARRLKEIWNYERWGAPEMHGTEWFYVHNTGLQDQPVLFATANLKQP